jgi:exodeoxyribonuclease V beta subunit
VDTLRQAGLPVPELGDQTIRGFLKGSIDLVFRHEGRWYVADYKSNRLGHDYAAFGPHGLAQAMAHGGYHLQAALYAVALHRWLRSRLRDYDPAVHLGGVYYLFIRGMHPAQGAHGVHAWQPSVDLLDTLSQLLAAEEATT